MQKTEIRELKGKALEISREMCQYAFFTTPVDELQSIEPQYQKDTYVIALFEQENPIATAACIPLTQNVRGKIFRCGGIANVASYPEGRRKGYAKKLLNHLLQRMKEEKQVFSLLYPFKETFYEKFGYVTLPQTRTANFSPNSLNSLLSTEIMGTVERYLLKDNFEKYLEILLKLQKEIHGLAIKPKYAIQQIRDKFNAWLAVARVDEKLTGFLLYNVEKPFEIFKVHKFYYEDSNTKYLLLQFLAKHVDQFKEIELEIKPDEQIECWIADSGVFVKSKSFAASPMGRVVSVENLSGMKVGTGSFSAKITDSNCVWNNNIYSFTSDNGILEVNKAEKAECNLTIHGLSALIFGGYTPCDFPFRGWSDASSNTLEKMKELFPKALPYIHSSF
jgi:predicted acetyltransferase